MQPRTPPDAVRLGQDKPHGTRSRYKAGCRCMPCRAANARYEAERARARTSGDWNGLVPAQAARRHILKLSKQGVGRRAVAAAGDVSEGTIFNIRSGRQSQIHKRTEERILRVSKEAPSDHALIRAARTWKQIRTLLAEGFTKAELARRLGYRFPSLQIGKTRIQARTAARVDRLFRVLMKE